jgi:luciferase family oxidoreductase group 1
LKTAGLKLSILDQSPVSDTETATDAFQNTIELAQKAEAWGYYRFWVAEHHGSNRVMGSSPEVLMSHLLAKTTRIRIGSGGVMLQHYSPYKVAENFNVLASLAPGRVDLGIGSGPGGMPQSTKALQHDMGPGVRPVSEKLLELERLIHSRVEADHPLYGLRVSPVPSMPAELFLLGTTPSSAELAARFGIPYIFALFLNHDVPMMGDSIDTYRSQFDVTKGTRPQAILALPVIAAETDEEAAQYASAITPVRIRLESGRTFTVFTVEAAEEFGRQSQEKFSYEIQESNVIHGSQATVQSKLQEIQSRYNVEEVIVVTALNDFEKRLRSFELLSQVKIPLCPTF